MQVTRVEGRRTGDLDVQQTRKADALVKRVPRFLGDFRRRLSHVAEGTTFVIGCLKGDDDQRANALDGVLRHRRHRDPLLTTSASSGRRFGYALFATGVHGPTPARNSRREGPRLGRQVEVTSAQWSEYNFY